ncbi:DNA-binding protein [Rhodoferax sp. BLA1]|uniref:DNA-binding protein n=1 Tax=Rhodoferax sp. BLA1 TaxID=2576062 RepID=UPI0015D277A7|nr:DNA-binding protein [Rhodoferax sp. BLA1]
METIAVAEARLQAEIEALRSQYTETQDLYREVCVLLFFRYGITPTANKLYQLVRKGSMSAPAEALTRFWETLREKSRVRIEHPDLPEPLRDAAGELMGCLWQRAQTAAQEDLLVLREDARSAVVSANADMTAAIAKAALAEGALAASTTDLEATRSILIATQADLARAQGEVTAQQRQIDAAMAQRQELQQALAAAREQFTRELEQQRTASVAAEERHAADMKRVLLDVDRERVQVTNVQKELEQSRRTLSNQLDSRRTQLAERQSQVEALRHRNGELEGIVVELRGQRDQMTRDIDSLRQRVEALPVEKPVAKRRVKRDAPPAKPLNAAAPSAAEKVPNFILQSDN